MALSIEIITPTPGAQLPMTFEVCGKYSNTEITRDPPDRNAIVGTTITVTLARNGVVLATVAGIVCGPQKWHANFNNVGALTDYVLTATISDGVDQASHAVETVDVLANAVVILPVVCCAVGQPPPGGGALAAALAPASLGFGASAIVNLAGTHNHPAPAGIIAVVQRIGRVSQVTQLPGSGTHRHVRTFPGAYVRYALGNLVGPNNWDVAVQVDYETYVFVYLEDNNGEYPARATSAVY
ncbi:MAG: hypothetical protein FJ304_02710 [Planctomycetes bacterium]|nr:hypothetical protein [Planctomycetota bacterium]